VGCGAVGDGMFQVPRHCGKAVLLTAARGGLILSCLIHATVLGERSANGGRAGARCGPVPPPVSLTGF
jgi:hypothetical protein